MSWTRAVALTVGFSCFNRVQSQALSFPIGVLMLRLRLPGLSAHKIKMTEQDRCLRVTKSQKPVSEILIGYPGFCFWVATGEDLAVSWRAWFGCKSICWVTSDDC